MTEREWSMVLAYILGEKKPLEDYIYEELGNEDLRQCANKVIAQLKGAKLIHGVDATLCRDYPCWFWQDGKNLLMTLEKLPADGFFRARIRDKAPRPSRVVHMNGQLPAPEQLKRYIPW